MCMVLLLFPYLTTICCDVSCPLSPPDHRVINSTSLNVRSTSSAPTNPVRKIGFEPTTPILAKWCSSSELFSQKKHNLFVPIVHHDHLMMAVDFRQMVAKPNLYQLYPHPSNYSRFNGTLLGFIYRGVIPQSSIMFRAGTQNRTEITGLEG